MFLLCVWLNVSSLLSVFSFPFRSALILLYSNSLFVCVCVRVCVCVWKCDWMCYNGVTKHVQCPSCFVYLLTIPFYPFLSLSSDLSPTYHLIHLYLLPFVVRAHTHTHTYICVCVCVYNTDVKDQSLVEKKTELLSSTTSSGLEDHGRQADDQWILSLLKENSFMTSTEEKNILE